MKKNFKKLVLNKSTLSNLDSNQVVGGVTITATGTDTTAGPSELRTACNCPTNIISKCNPCGPSMPCVRSIDCTKIMQNSVCVKCDANYTFIKC